MKKSLLLLAVVALVVGATTTISVAQVPGGLSPGGPAPGAGPGAAGVPIDGGASLLLAGGVAYAVRHLRARRKRA